jgi:hypothetical protein
MRAANATSNDFWKLFDWLRHAVAVARIVGLPLAIAIFAGVVLAFPGQALEYYRVLALDLLFSLRLVGGEIPWFSVAYRAAVVAQSLVAILVMGACISYSAHVLARERRQSFPLTTPFWRGTYVWTPVVIGLLPLLGAAIGFWQAGRISSRVENGNGLLALSERMGPGDFTSGIRILIQQAQLFSINLRSAAVAMLLFAVAFAALARRSCVKAQARVAVSAFVASPLSVVITGGMTAGLIALFLHDPVYVPQALGSIVIFALFIVCLVALTTQISIASHRIGIPINQILVVLAILYSVLDTNDNHSLRRVGRDGGAPDMAKISALPAVEDAFLQWYSKRPDKSELSANGKYPVFIVAAQGGGIYAAAQTLLFLTRMQELCERFSQHLFAISGVSGGSVGAALYSAFARDYQTAKTECAPALPGPVKPSTEAHGAYLAAYQLAAFDYLSPLLAGALFADFAQRFLPFPIPSWSRARALERALEVAWNNGAPAEARAKGNPLQLGLVASWSANGERPALLLNTTETGSGRRRVIAPFRFGESENNDLRFLPMSADYDVPLSTAAVASARFPWLTPAAWFKDPVDSGNIRRMVDGGYFENSGVATAEDLIERLQGLAVREKLEVEFHLIAMTAAGFPTEDNYLGLGELISPIMSLLNARRAQTNTTVDLADRKLGPIDPGKGSISAVRRLQRVELKNMLTPLPLGWRLSLATNFQILLQVGIVNHCHPNAAFEQTEPFGSTADCVKLFIDHQLRGDDLGIAADAAGKGF